VDAFISKLNPAGSALVYSTYLGGIGDDHALGIALDTAGGAYVTGVTSSADFPTTPGTLDASLDGPTDAFVTKLNQAGSGLVYSSYLGGIGSENTAAFNSSFIFREGGIAVDSAGNAYVTGATSSGDFPTTPGALDTVYNSGFEDAFVTKIGGIGASLCGHDQEDRGNGQVADEHGGNGGDFDLDECDENHQVGHRDPDHNVDFHSTSRNSAPTFDALAPKATSTGEGLNNGKPVTYTLVVTDLGVGPGTDIYSLTLSDSTGVIYVRTGIIRSGNIVVRR
jgi:hypothetical protein